MGGFSISLFLVNNSEMGQSQSTGKDSCALPFIWKWIAVLTKVLKFLPKRLKASSWLYIFGGARSEKCFRCWGVKKAGNKWERGSSNLVEVLPIMFRPTTLLCTDIFFNFAQLFTLTDENRRYSDTGYQCFKNVAHNN